MDVFERGLNEFAISDEEVDALPFLDSVLDMNSVSFWTVLFCAQLFIAFWGILYSLDPKVNVFFETVGGIVDEEMFEQVIVFNWLQHVCTVAVVKMETALWLIWFAVEYLYFLWRFWSWEVFYMNPFCPFNDLSVFGFLFRFYHDLFFLQKIQAHTNFEPWTKISWRYFLSWYSI